MTTHIWVLRVSSWFYLVHHHAQRGHKLWVCDHQLWECGSAWQNPKGTQQELLLLDKTMLEKARGFSNKGIWLFFLFFILWSTFVEPNWNKDFPSFRLQSGMGVSGVSSAPGAEPLNQCTTAVQRGVWSALHPSITGCFLVGVCLKGSMKGRQTAKRNNCLWGQRGERGQP